jgi:glycosyltransferase involved in cell wall biosynthesis
MKDFVTIIVPTYERPIATEKCVKNLLKQTFKNFEIIIIDDSSKKNYKIKNTDKIRYIKTERRLGLGRGKNLGIKLAKGNIILVVDDDIILKPNYIEILVKTLRKYKKYNVGAVGGRLLYPQLPDMGIREGPLVKISKLTGEIYAWFS